MMDTFFSPVSDGKLYCRKYGQGLPIILIHGACVDSDFFHDTAQILARQFSVYTYDRRGYGRSNSCTDHTILTQVEDVVGLIRQISTPCHIVAHSGGTVIAMELAAKHPSLVRKLVLHEPIDTECMDIECDAAKTLDEIGKIIRTGKYNKAIAKFLPLIGERDVRARDATDEELQHIGQNCRCFAQHEFDQFFSYSADASALANIPITIGVGEQCRDSHRWTVAHGLAHKLNAGLIFYPGAHNCAFDLPREFAYLTAGILLE